MFISIPVAATRDYIDVWPEGWSEVTELFDTSIFTDRFLVAQDPASGTGFLTADGLYFKELDLVYRLVKDGEVQDKITIASQRELIAHRFGTDDQGNLYAVWIEKTAAGYTLNYARFGSLQDPEPIVLMETDHTIRDLDAFQQGAVTHVVWSEWEEHLQIKYGRIENAELVTIDGVTNNSNLSMRPSVTVDHRGYPFVAWMESDPRQAIRLYFSRKTGSKWEAPQMIGPGSVADVEQGGAITLLSQPDAILVAWAAFPRNTDRLFVHITEVDDDLDVAEPTLVALGSRPRLISDDSGLQLIWQAEDRFGARIHHAFLRNGRPEKTTNLTVGRKAGFRPEVLAQGDYLYVYWLQADPERAFNVHTINNQFPKAISWWQKAGIDEKAPAYHLLYLFMSNFMLSFAYLFGHVGVLLAGGIISFILQRFAAYQKQNLFYKITLTALFLLVLRSLPIPMAAPAFFGLIHYGVSVVLAILGTYLILRDIQQEGIFLTLSILLLWMFLFLFFSLIPQTILG